MSNPAYIFDIDGVIYKGGQKIQPAQTALEKIFNTKNGKFTRPVAFVTNGDNMTRKQKANELSKMLSPVVVQENTIVMANTPISVRTEILSKRTLLLGGGSNTVLQASELGFTDFKTTKEVVDKMPYLYPWNGAKYAKSDPDSPKIFQKFEQIVITGLCQNWEFHLQTILDCLFTNGDFWQENSNQYYLENGVRSSNPKLPQLPIYICNLDLEYSAQAPGARFSNGSFITCLEALYLKMSGKKLIINDIFGKPAISTYKFAIEVLEEQAKVNGMKITDIYGIGDNVQSDIAGPNLLKTTMTGLPKYKIHSVLVCTGCFQKPDNNPNITTEEIAKSVNVNHAPSFLLEREMNCVDSFKFFKPDYVFDDVEECVLFAEEKN